MVGGGGEPPPEVRAASPNRGERYNYRLEGFSGASGRVRAYAEKVLLEEWEPVPIPDGVSDEEAAMREPCAAAPGVLDEALNFVRHAAGRLAHVARPDTIRQGCDGAAGIRGRFPASRRNPGRVRGALQPVQRSTDGGEARPMTAATETLKFNPNQLGGVVTDTSALPGEPRAMSHTERTGRRASVWSRSSGG